MKILIADSFPESHRHTLRDGGHVLTFEPTLQGDALTAAVLDHEVLIVRGTKVDAGTLDAGGALKLVIRAGAGTNTIDKTHAARNQIRVCNVPGANAMAVAELVLGLILAIDRHLASNIIDLRNQRWNKKKYSQARGLYGLSLGIFGMGAIGLAVAQRAHAFGMRVQALAQPGRAQQTLQQMADYDIRVLGSQGELLASSDVISLHLPFTETTDRMVNAEFLGMMKDGAMLINTSRGELVDEAALRHVLEHKGIRAGLDVFQNEPASGEGTFESPLANHPNVRGTHHIGASTEQAQLAVADGVLGVLDSYAQGALLHCVNE